MKKMFPAIMVIILLIAIYIMAVNISYEAGYYKGVHQKGHWYQVADTVNHWYFEPDKQ